LIPHLVVIVDAIDGESSTKSALGFLLHVGYRHIPRCSGARPNADRADFTDFADASVRPS